MSWDTSFAFAGVIGLLSGSHAAIWGMYKDSVYEGLGAGRFARSMVVGAVVAALLQSAIQLALPTAAALVVLFGLAYAAERGIVELWKTFVREENQSKYFIPMQFSIGGVPVASRATRWAAGVGTVAALSACLLAIAQLDRLAGPRPLASRAALVGLAAGLIVAIGGCWKDAPKEGFDPLKFFRSPVMTVLYALILARFVDSYLFIAVAAIGYERATVETYKTFLVRSKPPGKFSGKPILHPHMLERRRHFVPAYVAISTAVLVCITVAL